MHLLFASDAFKGTLTSREAHAILAETLLRLDPASSFEAVSVADGGEGTLEAFEDMGLAVPESLAVHDARMRAVTARFATMPDGAALIEMAQAAGLPQLPEALRDPRKTTTFGVGELMARAIEKGAETLYVGLGGSATNDGATGALAALGFAFLDERGETLAPCGENLSKIAAVDASRVPEGLRRARITLLTDVTNPLLGPKGCASVFAPQKGADEACVAELETGMRHFYELSRASTALSDFEGAGAAGGMAYGLAAWLGARVTSGIGEVMRLARFEEKLARADAVITGEGSIDAQSADGKVLSGILRAASKAEVPVYAIAGGTKPGFEALYAAGLRSVVTLCRIAPSKDEAVRQARRYYAMAAERLLREILGAKS